MLWNWDPENVLRREKLKRLFPLIFTETLPISRPHIFILSTFHEPEPEDMVGSSAAAPRTPHKWRWRGKSKAEPRKSPADDSDQGALVGTCCPEGQAVSRPVTTIISCSQVLTSGHPRPQSNHHLPRKLGPQKSWAAMPLLSEIFLFESSSLTTNASVWTKKRILRVCVCVRTCALHTIHTGSYSLDRVSINSRLTGTASLFTYLDTTNHWNILEIPIWLFM